MANQYTVAAAIEKYGQYESNFISCEYRPKGWARFFRCNCYRLVYMVNNSKWITYVYPWRNRITFETYQFNDMPQNLLCADEDNRSAHQFMKQIIDTYVRKDI